MTEARRRMLREGLTAGLLGYATVVALFALLNLAAGEWVLRTPFVLGSALLGSALDQPGAFGPILAYNGLHLLVSLALGTAAAALAARAEVDHDLGSGLVFIVLVMGGWVPLTFGAVTVEYLHVLAWPEVVAGCALGGMATLGYLALAHRTLVRALFREAAA
ncbi:MAG: hypothetical protein RQ751_09980 [Longimicrobiales bacterium]|nr:hypothetical protein [Longimicrobiales bacterium]